MLGLRKSFNARRKNRDSTSSSLADGTEEPSAMDAIRQGLSDPIPALKGKTEDRANVSVSELAVDAEEETQVDSAVVSRQSSYTSVNGSQKAGLVRTSSNGTAGTTLSYFGRVRDVFQNVTSLITRNADFSESAVKETDFRAYLHFISDERLIHMPRRGSDWDRVLSNAQFFGLQVWLFGKKIDSYIPGGRDSAKAALASCQILLETGHAQAPALLPTFVALYELAMLLSNVGQLRDLEHMSAPIKENAAHIFCDLVSLTGDIAVHYSQKIAGLKAGLSVAIDFDHSFGNQITDIWRAKQALYDQIWAYKLGRKRFSITIESLRDRLSSSAEASVRSTLYDEVADSLERSEDTCHWVKHQLTQFLHSNDQVLSVTGPAGSGKSMLAEWVQERLSRPLDHQNYVTIDHTFPNDSPTEATALACVKNLLTQLLERNVGDIGLYEHLVIAFEDYAAHRSAEKLEASLWGALRSGLQVAQQQSGASSVVIITDGCDSIPGGDKSAIAFHTALRNSVSKLSGVRVITFSRPVSHLSDGCRHIVVSHQELQEDIRVHLGQTLAKSAFFNQLNASAREEIVEDLTAKAKGSFLWAYFAGRLFQAATQETLPKLKQTVTSDITSVLQTSISETRIKADATLQSVLSFMLVAARPFTVDELTELMAVNVTKRVMDKETLNLMKWVPEKCGDIVVIRGGRLHFRSSLVRTHLSKQMGTVLMAAKDAHLQLTMRALFYARLHLAVDRDPMLGSLDDGVIDDLVIKRKLLLYAVQNWTLHFKECGLVAADGAVTLPQGFVDIFPNTVTFALLERTFWQRSHSVEYTISLHQLGLRVRQASFGEKHITVLQSLITLSHSYRSLTSSSPESLSYLFKAIKLGAVMFSETSVVVSTCVSLFLSWTESIVITKRTEVVTYREEVIRIMITICKHKYGHSSDEVIRWYEKLSKLYVDIKEEEKATITYRELYEIIVVRHGKKSDKAREIGSVFGTLDVVLKGEDAEKDIGGLEVLIFETNEDMEASDKMSITMTIRLALSYLNSGKFFLAERLYLTLWRRITALCTVDSKTEIHIAKIHIALEYVKFLRGLKRTEEASNILICLWAEYEHFNVKAEALTIWIREIGISCKTVGLLTISASILAKVWGWFKSKNLIDNEEARKTTVLITEVVEEITETTITKKTTKIVQTEVTETAVREIFEVHLTRCQKTKVDKSFFSSCFALTGLYIQDNRWAEAEVVIKKALELTWKAVLSANVKISLSVDLVKENVLVARRLALCYQHQGLVEQAELVYLRLYYACLTAATVDQALLTENVSVLVEFYEQYHRHDKVIEVYVEVLDKYRKLHGASHKLTIDILYRLAARCELLGRQDASKYYLEIVTTLNKGLKHCHHDALKAALFLCNYYHARKMWVELRGVCASVWETIVHHRADHKLDMTIITEIHKKYTYVLEVHAKVEFSVLYSVTVQYKEVAVAVAGATSTVAILALIELAKICEKHESHYHESVTIYEEVLKKVTTTKTTEITITETTIHTVKKRLSTMYVTVITTGKTGTVTKPTIERGIEIALQAYAQVKLELGCWHETTLLKLKEVVILYHRVATEESRVRITQMLQASVLEIITAVTQTGVLFASAKTLASIYISVGQVTKGQELLHQLRHLVIFRDSLKTSDITLKLDVSVSKAVFSFLVAFELALSGEKSQALYTEMMVNIVYEAVLYQEYSRVVEKETRLEVILESGAKLRAFWAEKNRTQLLTILDERLLQIFVKQYAAAFKGADQVYVRTFYLAIAEELAKEKRAATLDFAALACKTGVAKVKAFIVSKELHHAQMLGHCVFQFASQQQLYRQIGFIQYGYKLAELLAGTELALPTEAKYDASKKAMLETSKAVMAEVLAASHAANIDYSRLQFEDLAGLIRLLGAQGNHAELVHILSRLWSRREELQKSYGWSPSMVLRIGTLLIHAQKGNKDTAGATATAELLYYNVRRGRGRLDAETLVLSRILASLYIDSGRGMSALTLHESVLKELVSACHEHGNNRTKFESEAKLHLDGLRVAQAQLKGRGKPIGNQQDLYDRVKSTLKLDLPAYEKWAESQPVQTTAVIPSNVGWNVVRDVKHLEMWKRSTRERSRPAAEPIEAIG
jgi:hypothetical protein